MLGVDEKEGHFRFEGRENDEHSRKLIDCQSALCCFVVKKPADFSQRVIQGLQSRTWEGMPVNLSQGYESVADLIAVVAKLHMSRVSIFVTRLSQLRVEFCRANKSSYPGR